MRQKPDGRHGADQLISKYLWGMIGWNDPQDPLRKQLVPREAEFFAPGIPDFSQEQKFKQSKALIHKYPDRAVLLATNQCFGHCRFCFRKPLWRESPWSLNESDLKQILRYVRQHLEIKELIISGGDPLTLSNLELSAMLDKFEQLPNLQLIRIASRALSFSPGRINPGLICVLTRRSKPVWFVGHFNHAAELGPATRAAIKRLIAAGIPILSQTVLLKGINDRVGILLDLFRALAGLGVKPYQLFQCDPAPGAAHFATELSDSLKLMDNFGKVSGLILPRFALELPGYGKMSPGPGWKISRSAKTYRLVSPAGKVYCYPSARSN